MAIERDTDKKLTVGSVKSAKQAEKKLAIQKSIPKQIIPPKSTARPQQALREMETAQLPKSKIGDLRKVKSEERYLPITFEKGTVKVKDPSGFEYDEERAIPKARKVFDTATEVVPSKSQAAKLFYTVKNAKTKEHAKRAYANLNEYGKKAFWSYAVANNALVDENISDDYKADRDKYAGSEYFKSQKAITQALEKQTQIQREALAKGKAVPIPKPKEKTDVQKRLESMMIDARARTGSARELTQGMAPVSEQAKRNAEEEAKRLAQEEIQRVITTPQTGLQRFARGAVSGLTAGLSESGMTPEQRVAYQKAVRGPEQNIRVSRRGEAIQEKTVGSSAYGLGQLTGQVLGGGAGEAALKGGLLAGETIGKQAVRGAIIGGAQQAGISASEGKTADQIIKDVIVTAGLGSLADIGLNKIASAFKAKTGRNLTDIPTQSEAKELEQSIIDFTNSPEFAKWLSEPTKGTKPLPKVEKAIQPIVDTKTGIRVPEAEIRAPKVPVKATLGENFDKLYSRFVDFNRPLKKVGEKPYLTATVNRASTSGVVENIIKNALVDKSGNKIGQSMKDLYRTFPQGEDANLFEQYMRHNNNIARTAQGKPVYPDFTAEQSAEVVKQLDALHPDWNEKQKAVTKWIDDFMQEWSVNRGLISPEDYANLRAMYPDYVPTNREFSELERNMTAGVSGAKGIGSQPSVVRKATGSSRNIVPTIENMMNLVNRTVNIAKKNEVAQDILNATRKNPNNLLRVLSDAEAEAIDKTKNNIVSVFENGKKVYMEVKDPELMRVFDGMSKSDSDITQLMRDITGKYKALITTKNPLFVVPNAVRDIQSGYINGSEMNPVKYAMDLFSAYSDIAKGAIKYQQYKGLGGRGGNFVASETKKFADEMVKNPNLFVKAMRGIEEFNNIIEAAPRYSEFKRTLAKTGDPQKALYAAYDITTNFSRGGDLAKQADAYIPYLNAGIQGVDKMIRQFGTKPVSTAAKGLLAITLPSVLLNEFNKDNPHYMNLDNRTRDTNFVFPNIYGPKDREGNPTTFIKLPKERSVGMIFGSLLDRFYSDDFKDYAKNLAASISPANPLTSNLFTPAMNIALGGNKTYSGVPIVPRGMENLSPYLQYDEKTSEIAKQFGKATNLSPKKVDYLIRSYLGVLAQIGIPATTKSTYAGESDTQKLVKPVVSRFTADVAYQNKSVQNFYDNLDEASKNVADQKKLQGKADDATKAISSRMNKFSDQMSELSKKANAEIDPLKQREIRLEIAKIAKQANEYYNKIKP